MVKFDLTINVPVLITLATVAFFAVVGWDRMSNMIIQNTVAIEKQEERIRVLERIAIKLETLLERQSQEGKWIQ